MQAAKQALLLWFKKRGHVFALVEHDGLANCWLCGCGARVRERPITYLQEKECLTSPNPRSSSM